MSCDYGIDVDNMIWSMERTDRATLTRVHAECQYYYQPSRRGVSRLNSKILEAKVNASRAEREAQGCT
jgi:hypothetical protein